MKKIARRILAASVVLGALGAGGFYGKKYVDEHYAIFNEEEMMQLYVNISLMQKQAFMMGLQQCEKKV